MKKKYTPKEEALFFYWLGYRLFTTVLRGHVMGHRRPFSAARDYLRVQSVSEGVERDACEFLVDVANSSGSGNLLEKVFAKWSKSARWRPELAPRNEDSFVGISESEAVVRGYVIAVAEFARCQTTPKRVLKTAGITRELATKVGVTEFDLDALSGDFVVKQK